MIGPFEYTGHIQTQDITLSTSGDPTCTAQPDYRLELDSISLKGRLINGEPFVVKVLRMEPLDEIENELTTESPSQKANGTVGNMFKVENRTRAFVTLSQPQFDRIRPLIMARALKAICITTLQEPAASGVGVISLGVSTDSDFMAEDENEL